MRELLEKGKRITVVPTDFRNANKGTITEVSSEGFIVELDYEPKGMLKRNYCEFFTNNQYGTLYFTSFPHEINGKTLRIANPSKHKYLQRRQYTRIKYNHDLEIISGDEKHNINTFDVSAGGMKFKCAEAINIDAEYKVNLPLSSVQNVECLFIPIRIEKGDGYTISGKFSYITERDRMVLTQFCAKRNIEIRNK
ncbi:MAG: PilZ domain-containing protein [Fusobacterium sp.]|nr:PilZ domain-containing protein [Fusobacterium sp.]